MNATSLYVSTCKLMISANPDDPGWLTDLCRLMPYLRQSLSCTVCGNLLIEPQTPTETNCQHHVCKNCKGGKKKLKPACEWCKDYSKYYDNEQLRILLQCYKKLCKYAMSSPLYRVMSSSPNERNIRDLVDEGASFRDEYKSDAGLSKSAYSMLPCIYAHTSTPTSTNCSRNATSIVNLDNFNTSAMKQNVSRNATLSVNLDHLSISAMKHYGSSMHSAMHPGTGNKMRQGIRRPLRGRAGKQKQGRQTREDDRRGGGRKMPDKKKRLGCRCGNATVKPGKLTCCGQRCPCYVGSKACLDCKCKGCRNPHTKEGQKIIRDVLDLKSDHEDDGLDADLLRVEGLNDLAHLISLEIRGHSSHSDLDLL